MQRVIEVWSSMPELYLLIIFASIFQPSIWLLIILLSLFGWMGLSDYVRAEFLRGRNLDYVRSARAMGLSNYTIISRHLLPNSLTPVITSIYSRPPLSLCGPNPAACGVFCVRVGRNFMAKLSCSRPGLFYRAPSTSAITSGQGDAMMPQPPSVSVSR